MKKGIIGLIVIAMMIAVGLYKYNESAVEKVNPEIVHSDQEHSYVVATSNTYATEIGAQVLENGGNAVDAAIAVSYALGVTMPQACGLGGGGCMVIYDPNEETYKSYNYFPAAPVSYTDKQSAFGVPGFVAGMEMIYQDYGTIELPKLIEYSYQLAKDGFTVDTKLAEYLSRYKDVLSSYSYFFHDGKILKDGDTLYQEDLAEVLKTLQTEGSSSFYIGEIAHQITAQTYLNQTDLSQYTVDQLEPVYGRFYDYDIISAPAPFGGITLIQTMKMLELTDIPHPQNDVMGYLETLNDITAIASNDRISHIADPNYKNVDSQNLTSNDYIKTLLENNDVDYIEEEEGETTTAFSIIDEDGMIVSCTMTIGNYWGSRKIVNGIVLNACLDNFSDTVTSKNAYAPGKKPRSFIAPTIIKKDDYVLSIGTPGGSKIVKILSQVLLDHLLFEEDIQTAINKNRALFTNYNSLVLENNKNRTDFVSISNTDYAVIYKEDDTYFGGVNAAGYIQDIGYFGAIDSRRGGSVAVK